MGLGGEMGSRPRPRVSLGRGGPVLCPLQTPVIALVGNDACWSQIAREQVALLGSNVACGLEYLGEHCPPRLFVPRFGDTRVTPCHFRVD